MFSQTLINLIARNNYFKQKCCEIEPLQETIVNYRDVFGVRSDEFCLKYSHTLDDSMLNLEHVENGSYKVEMTFTIYDWL